MYVAVKGGEKAIANAHALQEQRRRGDDTVAELSVAQIEQQMNLAVDRVMTEGGIADRELAALALKQASGDNVEAIFLLRAYRTTLAKLAVSEPLNSAEMRLERRISAVYKDIPGGQPVRAHLRLHSSSARFYAAGEWRNAAAADCRKYAGRRPARLFAAGESRAGEARRR